MSHNYAKIILVSSSQWKWHSVDSGIIYNINYHYYEDLSRKHTHISLIRTAHCIFWNIVLQFKICIERCKWRDKLTRKAVNENRKSKTELLKQEQQSIIKCLVIKQCQYFPPLISWPAGKSFGGIYFLDNLLLSIIDPRFDVPIQQ